MEIVWTERAVANLEYFKKQVRIRSGLEDVADKFYDKVIAKVSILEIKPEWIGVPVKEYPGQGFKSIFVMDYRIVFRVSGNVVYIVTFLHKRMVMEGML